MTEPGAKTIMFAGGGTAGHLMPAINIAGEMVKSDREIKPVFVGKRGGMEKAIVKRFGYEIFEIDAIGMKRTPWGILKFMLYWNISYKQAKKMIDYYKPTAIIGTGGYVSAPVIVAGAKRGIPVFLQEQNTLPGLATRKLAKYARIIFIAYESARKYFPDSECLLTGNPIRADLVGFDRQKALDKFDLDNHRKVILVLGGSSGAAGVNRAIDVLLKRNIIPENWQLLWQTGKRDYELYRDKDTHSGRRILAFIDDTPAAYAAADIIISRAGAMALAEIAAAGIPSILIPYPFATGDHQTLNAEDLAGIGAAVIISESEIESKLEKTLIDLLNDPNKRTNMSQAALKAGKPGAAREIAEIIIERIDEVQKN